MSDGQIRDLFEDAEEWSPDDDDRGDGNAGGGGPTPNLALPTLQLGSDVEIARCVATILQQQHGKIIFAEGSLWYYAETHWHLLENHELRCIVHQYDGAPVTGGRPIRLNKSRIDSIIYEMTALLADSDFFKGAAVGINCNSGFISFSTDGTPKLETHSPEHRCRHVLSGEWHESWADSTLKDVFWLFELAPNVFLLQRLLEGCFLGDEDVQEKQALLAEIAGAAALGHGTKLMQPKAVILEGKTAENGKSQILDLLRGLLPPSAIATVPAAKMGDQSFLVQLAGKHLNASDELSGADAISSDIFKSVVTGEPVTGRDLYHSAVQFRPIAQHVFGTNALPSFKGGIDRGVQRRLLVLTFNRAIPESERVESIGRRIAEEEASLLLSWAVIGASRLIRQRRFTVPPSSKSALGEWLLGADPVLAWIEACVEEVDPKKASSAEHAIKSRDAYERFRTWAIQEGFRENMLPAINGFVQRLRASRPSISRKHTRDGNVLTGLRFRSITESEGTNFFPTSA
jgi:putative DNA primase/helicase